MFLKYNIFWLFQLNKIFLWIKLNLKFFILYTFHLFLFLFSFLFIYLFIYVSIYLLKFVIIIRI